MKIIITNQKGASISYLVEREKGIYNNINETVTLTENEMQGLTDDEIKTLGYLRIKSIIIRVFEQIEPLDEKENPIGFELISPRPVRINIFGMENIQVGQAAIYEAVVYDQYGQIMNDIELLWENKTINAVEVGEIVVSASIGDITATLSVSVIEKIKTREELLQEEIASQATFNLDLDYRLSVIELGL